MLTLRLLLSMALRLVAKSIQLHAQSGQPWLIELLGRAATRLCSTQAETPHVGKGGALVNLGRAVRRTRGDS